MRQYWLIDGSSTFNQQLWIVPLPEKTGWVRHLGAGVFIDQRVKTSCYKVV